MRTPTSCFLWTVCLAFTGLIAAAFPAAEAGAETTLERVKREGVINVGIFNEVPAGYITEDGELTGESPEILRVILEGIGDIEMNTSVVDEFGGLIPGVMAGRFDIIAAGMYIKPARCQQISFTRPTVKYGETLIVLKGNPEDIHSYEDIRDRKDLRVMAASGGMEVKFLEQVGVASDQVLVLPNYPTAFSALKSGRVDAITAPAIVGQAMIKEGQGVELADPFHDPIIDGKPAISYAGLGVRKQDGELLAALNAGLDEFVNSAEHLALVERFGFTKSQLPGDRATSEICAGM